MTKGRCEVRVRQGAGKRIELFQLDWTRQQQSELYRRKEKRKKKRQIWSQFVRIAAVYISSVDAMYSPELPRTRQAYRAVEHRDIQFRPQVMVAQSILQSYKL